MYNEIAIAAQTVDSHFSYMGLEESAADLLRHLLWEIEEYREADAEDRVKEATDIAILALRLVAATGRDEGLALEDAVYTTNNKCREVISRMNHSVEMYKKDRTAGIPMSTPQEYYSKAKQQLNTPKHLCTKK